MVKQCGRLLDILFVRETLCWVTLLQWFLFCFCFIVVIVWSKVKWGKWLRGKAGPTQILKTQLRRMHVGIFGSFRFAHTWESYQNLSYRRNLHLSYHFIFIMRCSQGNDELMNEVISIIRVKEINTWKCDGVTVWQINAQVLKE